MKPFLTVGITLAIAILCQALLVQEEILPDEDARPTGIQDLLNRADSLFLAKDIDSAIVIAKIAVERIEPEPGKSDSLYAWVLFRLGVFYSGLGNFNEGVEYYKRSLEIMKRDIWPDHSEEAYRLRRLGSAFRILYRYAEAESCFKQALQISEKTSEPAHGVRVNCLGELGIIRMSQLRYAEAESLHKQALKICTEELAYESEASAKILNRLATLYSDQGRYDEAESLYEQGLEIRKKVFHPDHPVLAETFNNLGGIYEIQGRYAEAESSYVQALRLREKAPDYGPKHPYLVYPLVNLGELYASQGNFPKADSFYNRALKIVEKAYGPDHLQVAWSIGALGDLCRWQGEYLEAESLYNRALDINKKIFGSEHPNVATSFNKLALLHGSTGEYSKSLANHKKLMESTRNFIENVFSYASEAQKIRYVNLYPPIDYSLLSLAVIYPRRESKSCALEMLLKGKAVVIDALSAEKEITYCLYDDRTIQMEKQLTHICSEIATMSLASINTTLPKEYRDSLKTLDAIKNSLETELSRRCAEFRDELAGRRFTVDDVVNALPQGSVLWEFVRYEPYDFKKIGNDEKRTGPPRYLVFTLDPAGNITLADLGPAEEIDSLITLARQMIYDSRAEVYSPLVVESERRLSEVTGKLYNIIFAPLESRLGDRRDVLISPDGQLSLLPFEILARPDGQYVIEKFRISYLSSGRDLLRFKKSQDPTDWALVMADPDFDLSKEALAEDRNRTLKKSSVLHFGYEPSRGLSGCLRNQFNPLPYSREETKSIGTTLEKSGTLDVSGFYGVDAIEEVLKGTTTAPRVLHLATHGYFCEDLDLVENKMLENPLLRSGLALAGANRLMDENPKSDSRSEDGVLTALEASGLNLIGTELVTLSACETGVGEVKNGEGVYGLRRAFQHAGARTIVMSLWKVPDKETCDLMNDFYRNWLSGQAKKEALRQAALNVLNHCRAKDGTAHPLLWGGFVMVGDPN